MSNSRRMKYIEPFGSRRVSLELQTETDDQIVHEGLPFFFVVLSDLSGRCQGEEPALIEMDPATGVDGLLERIQPSMRIPVSDPVWGGGTHEFQFRPRRMAHFTPDGLLEATTPLQPIAADSPPDADGGNVAHQRQRLKQILLRDPRLLALEGRWRGVERLFDPWEGRGDLRLQVVDIDKPKLSALLEADGANDWRSGKLFQLLRDPSAVGPREATAGCILVDASFDHGSADVAALRWLGVFGEAIHAPVLVGAAPTLAGLTDWRELHTIDDLAAALASTEHARWSHLRDDACSRFLYLSMPRLLGRGPYPETSSPDVAGCETSGTQQSNDRAPACWINSAYLMAMNIVRSFEMFGWFARIRGLESGGAWEDLPVHAARNDSGEVDARATCEVSLGYATESALASQGLMPVLHPPGSDLTVFIGARSLHRPPQIGDSEQLVQTDLGSRLSWLLCGCRFARFVESIAARGVGAHVDIERLLMCSLNYYVAEDSSDASIDRQSMYPLASAEITLLHAPEGPGVRMAELVVRPKFQFNGAMPRLTFRIEWTVSA